MISTMTHGSLFSGIGGFELGAQMAGIETIWNCEIEEFQRNVLKKKFPKTKQYNDIRELHKPEQVDIISGGFPCQDISIANRNARGIIGERSGLWTEMFRVVCETKPKYLIIENSPMLLKRGFEYILHDISKIGYDAEWQVLSSAEFGYFHNRKRLYVVAYPDSIGVSGLFKNFSVGEARQRWENSKKDFENFIEQEDFNGGYKSKIKPLLFGETYGIPDWMDRITAIGNSVIPEIAHYLFECIKEFDKQFT
jgi:DNA (cytosine-5)-methyltransferase 1